MSGDVYQLADLTWPQVDALKALDPIVLVPVGSTEAHGPHLPLRTDVIISEGVVALAAQRLVEEDGRCVLIAPALTYGVTEFAAPFAGTISVSAATLQGLVEDICRSLGGQGFPEICLVNNHLEPAHIETLKAGARAAAEADGLMVTVPDNCTRRWGRTLTDEFKSGACHAGQYETSLVLAREPATVEQDICAALTPNPESLSDAIRAGAANFIEAGGPNAYFGYPADATEDEGRATYALLAEMVVTTVRESRGAASE